jgi:hypothetical protein
METKLAGGLAAEVDAAAPSGRRSAGFDPCPRSAEESRRCSISPRGPAPNRLWCRGSAVSLSAPQPPAATLMPRGEACQCAARVTLRQRPGGGGRNGQLPPATNEPPERAIGRPNPAPRRVCGLTPRRRASEPRSAAICHSSTVALENCFHLPCVPPTAHGMGQRVGRGMSGRRRTAQCGGNVAAAGDAPIAGYQERRSRATMAFGSTRMRPTADRHATPDVTLPGGA